MNQIKLQVTLKTLADKGPGLYLYGPWVTPEVHKAFANIMRANHMDDPAHHARQKCCAFFQGGSENPNGKYVFIELWTFDPSKWEDFEKIVNEKVTPLIDLKLWGIPLNSLNLVSTVELEENLSGIEYFEYTDDQTYICAKNNADRVLMRTTLSLPALEQ